VAFEHSRRLAAGDAAMEHPRVLRRDRFAVTLQINDSGFINPPDVSQKNWILTRQLEELAADLDHLDDLSKRMVAGSKRAEIVEDWSGARHSTPMRS
jgi:hypothetical protein